MAYETNTKPMSWREIRGIVGWKKFYNPFICLAKEVKRKAVNLSSPKKALAIWSSYNSATRFFRHMPLHIIISIIITAAIFFPHKTELYTSSIFTSLMLVINLFSTWIITAVIACSFPGTSSKKRRISPGILLDIRIKTTGHAEVDFISRLDVFETMHTLRNAGFKDSEIIALATVINEVEAAHEWQKEHTNSVPPSGNSVNFSSQSVVVPEFILTDTAQQLVAGAVSALGMIPMHTSAVKYHNGIIESLAHAGIMNMNKVSVNA